MKEFDLCEVLPTMQLTVAWLRSLGFETTDSGDGVSNVKSGMEGTLGFPHVIMVIPDPSNLISESHRLLEECHKAGLTTMEVEATYSPQDNVAVLSLLMITDESWVREHNETRVL